MTDKDLARIKAALAYDQGLSPAEGRALVAALEEARQAACAILDDVMEEMKHGSSGWQDWAEEVLVRWPWMDRSSK